MIPILDFLGSRFLEFYLTGELIYEDALGLKDRTLRHLVDVPLVFLAW